MQQNLKKGWLGGHFFSTRVRRVRARKPRWEFKGSALEPFLHVFLRLNGASIVLLNYHIKASVKLVTFGRENQIIPWQVCILLPTLF